MGGSSGPPIPKCDNDLIKSLASELAEVQGAVIQLEKSIVGSPTGKVVRFNKLGSALKNSFHARVSKTDTPTQNAISRYNQVAETVNTLPPQTRLPILQETLMDLSMVRSAIVTSLANSCG